MLSNTLANIPATALTGTLFIATDTFALYRYDGSTWQLIGGPGTGTITGSGTANQVAYFTASGVIASNTAFQFNGTTVTVANDAFINGLTVGKGANNELTNTAIGIDALKVNTTGNVNTALGYYTLRANTTGVGNIAVGAYALTGNQSGNSNIAIGINAMLINATGDGNVSIGVNTLLDNDGNNNTAVGESALNSNTSGNYNTALGANALSQNTTGTDNIGIGQAAMSQLVTGNQNIAIGGGAGNPTGFFIANSTSNGVYIGYGAQSNLNTNTNEIVIGYNAVGNGSNTVTLGNTSIVNTYLQGTVNANHVAVTKSNSGIALNITDSANGNALNINKTGSGFAINVAAGVSNFLNIFATGITSTGSIEALGTSIRVGATSSDNVTIVNNEIYASSNGSSSPIYINSSSNGNTIINRVNGRVLIRTATDDLVNALQVNGSVLIGNRTQIINGTILDNLSSGNNTGIALSGTGIFPLNGSGVYTLKNIGSNVQPWDNIFLNGAIKTGAPSGGAAEAWKLGSYIANPTITQTGYLEIEVAGVAYKLLAGT